MLYHITSRFGILVQFCHKRYHLSVYDPYSFGIGIIGIGIAIGRYEKFHTGILSEWPIRKLSLSGFIGIGQYEKKLISRTLSLMTHKCCNF